MRICWRVVAVAFICFPIASVALLAEEVERHDPEIDLFASMADKCSTLKVAERDFACSSVAFTHSPGGRSSFIVPLNDPDDDTHIITFSDEKGRKYEFQFESDGSPIKVRMIRATDPETEERRAQVVAAHIEQLKCRQMANVQGVLPRDRTAFILRC